MLPQLNQYAAQDTLAERLRRRPAKPMGSPRVGSNPTGVEVIELPGHTGPPTLRVASSGRTILCDRIHN